MTAIESKVCGIDCTLKGDSACPSGHSCVTLKDADGNDTAKQCVPQTGACTAFTPPLPVDTTTGPSGDAGPTPVPGCTPSGAEVCDGVDNDCDGKVDEGNDGTPLAKSCGVGLGECVGSEVCKAGVWGACTAPAPKAEVCNGKDDNCDGSVDEGVNNSPDACGETCAVCPGGSNTQTTKRSCEATNGTFACVVQCRGDNYDANDDMSDGCETPDDSLRNGSAKAFALGTVSDDSSENGSVSAHGRFPADNAIHESAPMKRSAPSEASVDWYSLHGEDTWFDNMEFITELDVRKLPAANAYEVCIGWKKNSDVVSGSCGARPAGALIWQSKNGCVCAMGGQSVSFRDHDFDSVLSNDSGMYYVRVRWVSGGFVANQSASTYTLTVCDEH